MEGIHFVVDSEGKKTAVIIDLERYGELLEDFFDIVISEHRLATEESISFEEVVAETKADRVKAAKEKKHAATTV